MAKLTVEGQEKEIKFVTVNKEEGTVSIAFTDRTMIFLDDVRVNITGTVSED